MGRLLRRPAARRDLIDIYRFIAEQSGHDRAAAYLQRIEDRLNLVSEQPGLGQTRLPRFRDVRVLPSDSHLLFYRERSSRDGIELIRVLHGARDWQTLLEPKA